MNLYRPIHVVFGYGIFSVAAEDFPRLADIVTEGGFNIWGIKRRGERVELRASVFSAEALAGCAHSAGISIEKLAQKGFPFLFARYRRRYGLMLGLVVGLCAMFLAQLFVWDIEISGNTAVSRSEILRSLNECGISVGCFLPRIDPARDSNRLLLSCRGLSSCAITVSGTRLTLSVLERREPPELVDTGGYYNVVAAEDGIIIDIDAADGTPEVHEGDTVYKGMLLINSFIEGTNGTYRPTHARGKVIAAVKRDYKIKIPLERTEKDFSGETQTKRIYTLLGRELPSPRGAESDYEYSDALIGTREVKLFGFIRLPMTETRITYSEYTPAKRRITEAFAREAALGELEAAIAETGCELISVETEFTADEENGVCILKANAVLKKDIAVEVEYELTPDQSISERLPIARE